MSTIAQTQEAKLLTDAQAFYDATFDAETLALLDQAADGDDAAWDALNAMTYNVTQEVTHYVTLAGGGPAARLAVTVNDDGDVENAWLEYQDWLTPWTRAPKQDRETVKRLATIFAPFED
ncbi:hypothetical protein [Streptomyces sp. cg40]|uniref:hypothetical protein n=1 Tax=Streptomyces sp. cg40 TaxID=3419764 RepID=UPI003CFF4901